MGDAVLYGDREAGLPVPVPVWIGGRPKSVSGLVVTVQIIRCNVGPGRQGVVGLGGVPGTAGHSFFIT